MSKKRAIIIIALLILSASMQAFISIIKTDRNDNKTNNLSLIDKNTSSESKAPTTDYSIKKEKHSLEISSINNMDLKLTLTNIKAPQPEKWGNTSGNIMNSGCFAFQDGYLYFFDLGLINNNSTENSYKIYRTKEDGITGLSKINLNTMPTCINLVGEWIYFCTLDYSSETYYGQLFRMKIDGSELEVIEADATSNLIIYDNTLYYIQNKNIYKRSIDKLNEKQLITENANYFIFSDDGKTLFYCPNKIDSMDNILDLPGNTIYSIETNGENKKLIYTSDSNTIIQSMFVYEKYLFFKPIEWNQETGTVDYTFTIKRLDYTKQNPISEIYIQLHEETGVINLSENYIYYSTHNFSRGYDSNIVTIYRKNLNNDKVESLQVDNILFISSGLYCLNNKVYFTAPNARLFSNQQFFSFYCIDFENKRIIQNKAPYIDLSN